MALKSSRIYATLKLSNIYLPTGLTVTSLDGVLLIYFLKFEAGVKVKVTGYVLLAADLVAVVSVDDVPVPANDLRDLSTNGLFTTMSQLINLEARMKSWSEEPKMSVMPLQSQSLIRPNVNPVKKPLSILILLNRCSSMEVFTTVLPH